LVYALDLDEVQRPTGIADEDRPRHLERRQRLPAPRGDGAGTRGEDFAALEERSDLRMVLELLESLERREARILIVEPDDVPDVHAVIVKVIEEAAGVGAGIRRPAEAVLDAPGAHAPRGQLPQLLVAERKGLRAVSAREVVAGDELFRDRPARTFGQPREW